MSAIEVVTKKPAGGVDAVRAMVAKLLRLKPERVQADTLVTDLGVDSFALVEMVIDLQEEFAVRLSRKDLEAVRTIGDLAALIERMRS